MRDIFSKCEKENRIRNEEEQKQWADLKVKRDAMDGEIRDLEIDADIAKRAAAQAKPVAHERIISDKEAKDFSKFSILRGLSLLAEGKPLDGIEAEVHAIASEEARKSGLQISGFGVPAIIGMTKRGQTVTGTTTTAGDQGGDIVATELNGLIEALWSKNFLSLLGATRLAGLVGNQEFPVQTSKPAASELTEIQADTATEILFDKVAMAPNRRGVTIPISKLLLIQNSFDVQSFVMNQMRMALDYKLNVDAINAILAAITTANGNLRDLGANGAAPTYADIVALETLIAAADADKDGIKHLTNSKVRGKLKLTEKFSTTGNVVWEKGNEMNGYPSIVSNIVPSNLTKGTSTGVCSAIVLGNFQDFYVGMWGGMDFVVDPYSAKKTAQVEITANMFWDTEVARAKSFAGIKDALTA